MNRFPEFYYFDRKSKKKIKEKVYFGFFVSLLYGNEWYKKFLSYLILPLISNFSFFSYFSGLIYKSRWSRKKILPFIKEFKIDTSEFLDSVDSFCSFNDFFIRKLKSSSRPLASGDDHAVLPADGRYLVYPEISQIDSFSIKGKKFCLESFLRDSSLVEKYAMGSLVIGRLSPVDYHRFHFPLNCVPQRSELINGSWFSVHRSALQKNINILSENKRMRTVLDTIYFGTMLFVEIGATCVGSIFQTFTSGNFYKKGDEKGYFSFGGSSIVLLFRSGQIVFDQDLVDASQKNIEVLGLMGQSLGKLVRKDF